MRRIDGGLHKRTLMKTDDSWFAYGWPRSSLGCWRYTLEHWRNKGAERSGGGAIATGASSDGSKTASPKYFMTNAVQCFAVNLLFVTSGSREVRD